MNEGSSGTGVSDEGACGNGSPVPDVYCFTFQNIDSILSPKLVVSANFNGDSREKFAVFALAKKSTTVSWDTGKLILEDIIPTLSPVTYTRLVAYDVAGTIDPELVVTSSGRSYYAPNEGGKLKPFIPIALPDSAFAELGHTIPIDLGNDGKIDYLKGSGDRLGVWRHPLDAWEKDFEEFVVPGCSILVDFDYGDFNSDDLADIVYIGNADTDSSPEKCEDPATHGVVVLLQTEVGGLTMMPILSTGQHKFLRVQTGDFDADGRADISALATNNDLLFFRSLGDGQFAPPQVVADVLVYVTGDIDADGSSEGLIFTAGTRETKIVEDIFAEIKLVDLPGATGAPLGVADLNQDGVGDIAFLSLVDKTTMLSIAISNP